ncbi:uncharacterized protein LOC111337848 [Stylophora pistillata]|nr:uncharacterized protein LOC111337848 [Stylophora pistillata]
MKIPALAPQFEKDANRRRYIPTVWSSPNPSLLQRRLYGPKRRTTITATVVRPAKINGNRHNVYQYWNHPSQGPHHRPVLTPKRGVQKTTFPFQLKYGIREHDDVTRNSNHRPVYGADDYSPSWSGQTTTLSDKRFRFSRNKVTIKTISPFVGRNGFRKAHKLRRDWIPFKPGTFIPLYRYTAIKRNFPIIMHTRVDQNRYEPSISPKAPSWLFTMQRNRIPRSRKMRRVSTRGLISSSEYGRATPGLTIPGLANNDPQREFAMQRNLELESSQDLNNAYESRDTALQNLLGEVNLSGSNLISESALNQPASSSSGYKTSAAEQEWRPVPRTSGTTSYMRKESKLNDPKLIRLRHILRNMKKRSLNPTRADSNDDLLSKYALRRTGVLYHSNDARLLDKRKANDEKEKRSSMRKAKGRWNWGILNELAPNVRLASMILLKQKRQDMRKRALQQSHDPARNSSAKIVKGRSTSPTKVESAPAVLKKEKEKSPLLSSETVSSNVRHVPHPSKRKKNKHKHARNFINVNGGGMYFNTRKGYLNRQFSPLQDNAATERYEPFFNTRGPFQVSQMAMADRMRAMRTHGLLHSLGNINPQVFFHRPSRFPLIPTSQRFMAMQRYGSSVGNFPSEYKMPVFPPTHNSFSIPWNMGVANRMTETQEAENEEFERATPQDSSDQASIPQTNEGFKTSISSLVGRGSNAEIFHSPTTAEESSQIIKIGNNGTFEGQPIVNAESFDANSQGLDEKATNLQLAGMQVTDQSATMPNKWYSLRNGKVSFMSDPRT